MKQTEGKIGIKEYVAIIALTVGTKLSDDTPTIIFENARNAGWIVVLLMGAMAFIPVFLLIKVFSAHKGKNLHEVIIHIFGKFFGTIISILLLVGGVAFITVDSGIYVDIIGTMYFTKSPPSIIYVILMLVCAYGAKRGIEQIGTVAWVLLPYLKITLLIALIVSMNAGHFGFIFPILGEGSMEILKASAKNISIFADLFFIGLIAPLVTSFKDFKKGTIFGLIMVTVEISLAMFTFVMLFDYTTAEMLSYPFHETIRYIQIGFLQNVETLFFPFWLVATFIRFSFYLYISAVLLGGILKIKEFEYLIPLITTMVILIGFAPESPSIVLFNMRQNLLMLLSPAFLFLPPLMWLIAKIRGDFKNGTVQESN
ncbi:endospore germination permease [Mesobacillus jeotgali]|jgi:spore germination protein KB|uniref:Endospore germination permease n=1 Tax=Mesobacillus jeotgali TaxID=129985 RepID=A0ABY9VEK8_9BACI|nr:endospore germination permease [Mesobacillus jeotgali]WNF22333.1 endospore germination permease [Mesobacillus jeotgali]